MKSPSSVVCLFFLALTIALAGCQTPSGPGADQLAEAVANPERPAADRVDDANRKPAQVLAALGIEPGMRVLDLLAGGGYHSEVLSRAVGSEGSVLFHNNRAYREFLTSEVLATRTANARLPNVEVVDTELADFAFEPGELDAVIFILGFHDLYFVVDDGSWPIIDPPKLLRALFVGLRPGGIFGVVDHAAVAGSNHVESSNGPHRIDEGFVRKVVEDAGFEFESSSDVLRNTEDDRLTLAMDESIRRRTDRFILRFRKPAETLAH